LLKREGVDSAILFALSERGVIRIALAVQNEQPGFRALMRRYRNRPMSLADACLVRLSEIHVDGEVSNSIRVSKSIDIRQPSCPGPHA
jgi:hypothetical protein